MKLSLFALLFLSFSLTVFPQSAELFPEETENMFTQHLTEILYLNLDSLKGNYIDTENNTKYYVGNHMLLGFTPYIRVGEAGTIFYGISKSNPQPPDFNRIVDRLTRLFGMINYKIDDSETNAKLKTQATDLNVSKMVTFTNLNYEKTEATEWVHLYLYHDGNYDVAIFNSIAKKNKPKATLVKKTKFSYDFSGEPGSFVSFKTKHTSSDFKNGKWVISSKAPFTRANCVWEKTFMLDFNSTKESDFEVTGSFTNNSSVDTASYGYIYSTHCKEDLLYNNTGFVFNKKNHTFSVFEFQLNSNQIPSDAAKKYVVVNKACTAPKSATADVLGVRRYKGTILFSVNNQVVYSEADTQSACPISSSPDIMVLNKAELEIDDVLFNYAPDSESAYFKTVVH